MCGEMSVHFAVCSTVKWVQYAVEMGNQLVCSTHTLYIVHTTQCSTKCALCSAQCALEVKGKAW